MARSNRLRLSDVRQAMRVVGECRDLGHDARAWLAHASQGAQQLLSSNIIITGVTGAEGFNLHSQIKLITSRGWENAAEQERAMRYLAEESHLLDPAFQRFQAIARPNITLRPLQLISRREFEVSEFHAVRRSLGMKGMLFSQRETANRLATFSFSPQRPPSDPHFSGRDTRLLALLHDELARLVGSVLSDGLADPLAALSPRLRQTLLCLLSGDSEKEAALRMGVSRHTVHDYVTALYRHFGVGSRPALMALCQQRRVGLPPHFRG